VCGFPLLVFDGDARFEQYGREQRTAPGAVHDGAVEPIEARDFLELSAHRVTAVACALQRADDIVLRKRFQVLDREIELRGDETGDGDAVCGRIDVGDRAVVAVIAIFCDEAVRIFSCILVSKRSERRGMVWRVRTSRPASSTLAPCSAALQPSNRTMTSYSAFAQLATASGILHGQMWYVPEPW
jgi:hypothetical protein